MTRTWIFTAVAALFLTTFATTVGATDTGKMFLTFNRSVAIPGATLAPGTYIFEKVDTPNRSDLVRVFSRDRTHVYLTQFTQAEERPKNLPADTHVTFGESSQDAPPRLDAWYPAGDDFGYHFIYRQP